MSGAVTLGADADRALNQPNGASPPTTCSGFGSYF